MPICPPHRAAGRAAPRPLFRLGQAGQPPHRGPQHRPRPQRRRYQHQPPRHADPRIVERAVPAGWPRERSPPRWRPRPTAARTKNTRSGPAIAAASLPAAACRSRSAVLSEHPSGVQQRRRRPPGCGQGRESLAPQGPAVPAERALASRSSESRTGARSNESKCGKQDLNLHGITTTRPSTWRVCQFRHSRSGANPNPPRQPKARTSFWAGSGDSQAACTGFAEIDGAGVAVAPAATRPRASTSAQPTSPMGIQR